MILCCGEALIDMLAQGEGFTPHAGGAVFNTAIALGRLGAEAGFLSGLSTDLFGARLDAALKASKVDTSLAVRSDRPTTLAFVTLTNGQASYAFYDENTAGRSLSVADLPALPDGVKALFFGGISLVGEPAADTYAALMQREAAHRVTMLDPNIRPSFIRDPEAYRDRIGRMIALSDIIKISDEDLHWLEGPGDPADLAQGLLAKGPRLVLLTEGAAGARAITQTENRFVAAPKVTVADTVGAGDTFNAGVLAALDRAGALHKGADWSGDLLDAALTLGTRAAAVTVSRAGATPPWSHEL
ncbi:carbohydrate kinase family protein [Falsirhodobacter algicola]|uniref:Carbohydrate kinase n=1 Tax=Falsirhodobacter algicola TaxID=2692330 RepID=A0A8J8MU67_9RHOB|nr:carbohydrate kinase [Falsirhodobacter algicola]QUS36825.1 carbohydrate kinase [Falsirhodobacter algicola]